MWKHGLGSRVGRYESVVVMRVGQYGWQDLRVGTVVDCYVVVVVVVVVVWLLLGL